MKVLPSTLFGQILLALFAGLLAAQALGIWFMLDDRSRLGNRLLGEYAARRIGGIISGLDHEEPEDLARLVRALDVPPTGLTLADPWRTDAVDTSEEADEFIRQVEQELEYPLPMHILSIRRSARVEPEGERGDEVASQGKRPSGANARSERAEFWAPSLGQPVFVE